MAHRRVPSKGLGVMDKRVPKSEKYSHVQGILDTGLTVNKVKGVTAREYAKRRDEIFFRITRTQLYELYNEYESEDMEKISDTIGGPGSSVRIVTYSEGDTPVYTKPYLLLDLREAGEFNRGHLLQARSFPYAILRRDQYHPEIYRYRNKAETLIILYCDDERISRDAAKDLVDRGIENVFLLTGGMSEFAYEFPTYIEGELPPPPKGKPTIRRQSQGSSRLGRIAEDSSYDEDTSSPRRAPTGASSPPNKLTLNKLEKHNASFTPRSTLNSSRRYQRGDNKSDAGTNASNMSVAESVISRAVSRRGKF